MINLPAKLFRIPEVAQLLGVGRTKIYQLIGTGELKSINLGRSRRIPLSAIEELVEKLKQEADDHG